MSSQIFSKPWSLVNSNNSTVAQNIELCKELSLQVARTTQWTIIQKIKETFKAEDAALFKQSRSAMIDHYGRVTYVYCQFLDKQIPVLQPGAFLIDAGVQYKSQLAIINKGVWKNGYILS